MPQSEHSFTNERMKAFSGNSFDDYYSHAMKDFPLPSRLFMQLVINVVGIFTKLLWPWKLEDVEKLIEPSHGRMIISNHGSMLDPIVLIVAGWNKGVRIRPVFKNEFNSGMLQRWFFSRVGGIPVKRGTADMKAVRRVRSALERGECVLVYPEGTRIKSDDDPVVIHSGFALMAQLAQAPIQPSAIVGARDITPKGKHIPRLFVRSYAKMGDEIEFSLFSNLKKKEQLEQMEQHAMKELWRLRDELRAKYPGKM